MSNDNPNSPPQNFPEPNQKRSRQTRRNQSQGTAYQNQPPFWKVTVIQLLRGTIGILENTVEKLENEEIGNSNVNRRGWWGSFLSKIRRLLPPGVRTQVSDGVLSAIVLGIVVIGIWTGSSLFTKQPDQVATQPVVESTPIATVEEPPETLTATPTPPTTTIQESGEEETPETPETPAIFTDIPIEPEVISEPEPEPAPTPIIIPEPQPEYIPLTPEQTLIAAIENRISEVSDRVPMGIVKSIQANFASSTLSVKISDEWYTLKASQQDEIASDIWMRSQNLDFTHLEIFDLQDHLLARNPVVGTQMIILQRHG